MKPTEQESNLESKIADEFYVFEEILKNSAVIEKGKIVDFDGRGFEVIELFDDIHDRICALIKPHIEKPSGQESNIHNLPTIVQQYSFAHFARYFENQKGKYPYISEWSLEHRSWENTFWEPLASTIRTVYNTLSIEEITNQDLFNILYCGYVKISEETTYYLLQNNLHNLSMLNLLKNSKFATIDEMNEINQLINIFEKG